MKLKGKPNKKFYRYVMPHQYARLPKKILLFQFDEKGEAEVKDGVLYDFELLRINRAAENNDARKAASKQIDVKLDEEPAIPEEAPAKTGRKSPSKEKAKDK
jgi:hypothetical protein